MEGKVSVIRLAVMLLGFLGWGLPLLAQAGRDENQQGNRLYRQSEYDGALQRYQQGIEKAPDSPVLRFNIGNARYKLEQFEEARQAFSEANTLEKDELRSQSFFNLGNAFYKLGRFQESIEAYKQALRLNPEDVDAKYNLELALKQNQENPRQQNQSDQDQQEEENEDSEPDKSGSQDQQDADQERQDDTEQQPEEPGASSEGQEPQDQQPTEPEERGEEGQQSSGQQESESTQEQTGGEQLSPSEEVQPPPMSREKAEQLLQALQENPRDFLKRKLVAKRQRTGGKDW